MDSTDIEKHKYSRFIPSTEEQSSWLRWGSLAESHWRGSLTLSPFRGWGLGAQSKRWISQARAMSSCSWKQLLADNYIIYRLWVCLNQGWGHMCEPMWCDFVCVCFLRRYFPLTQHKSTVNFLNTSHHHCTLTIHYLILPSTQPLPRFGNILLPHMKMVLRQRAQAPDLLSGKARLIT